MTPVTPTQSSNAFDPFDVPAVGADAKPEVIVIVHPPNAPSKVVIIDNPSEKFLSYLDGHMAAQQTAVQTSQVSPQETTIPQTTSRFTIPGEEADDPVVAYTSPFGDRTSNSSWQPTALVGPFRPQQYIRSPHTRLAK